MRIMGIDYGSRRMGIAISDELKMLAHPLEWIPAEPLREFLARLKRLAAEKEVELIVVGLPRNMDGSFGPAAEKVRAFIATLKAELSIPIREWDERLTSVQANRFLRDAAVKGRRKKEKVDALAAAVLLQDYLDRMAGQCE